MKYFLFLIISSFVVIHAQESAKVKIALKSLYQYRYAGMVMAKEKGIYEKYGLDVELIEHNPKTNNLLQVTQGDAEYGISDASVLLYRAQGRPLRIVASIFQHHPMVLLTRHDSGITNPSALKGKKIAYQKGGDGAAITAMLKFAGLKPGDYSQVSHNFKRKKLLSGKVDAIEASITDEPYRYRKKGIKTNILNPMDYGIDLYGDNIVTTDDEISNHPERVKAVVQATLEGWKYAFAHTDEAVLSVKKLNPSLDIGSLKYEAMMTERLIMPDIIPIGKTSQERYKLISNLYASLGMADEKELHKALQDLVYHTDDTVHELKKFFIPVLAGFAVLAMIALFLYLNNKRLNFLVKKQTKELESLAGHFQRLMETQQNIIVLSNLHSPEYANKSFYEFTGFATLDDFLRRYSSIHQLFIRVDPYFHSGTIRKNQNWIEALEELPDNKRIVSMIHHTSRIPHVFTVSVTPFEEQNYLLNFSDISSTMQDYIEMERKATHDPLTGARNRAYLESHYQQFIQKTHLLGKELCIMLFDIDHFKSVNDTYGHGTGDAVLKHFVSVLNTLIRTEDIIVRWGGEEFMLLIAVTAPSQGEFIAEQLRRNIEKAAFEEVKSITCSIGLTLYKKEESLTQTIGRADEALYKAKSNGRNRVEAFW